MGISLMMMALVVPSIQSTQQGSSVDSAIQTLVADINQQQIKAMLGEVSSSVPIEYGVHFTPTGYVVFKGSTYSAADTSNITITLSDNLTFNTINIPDATIAFSRIYGEVVNYSATQHSIELKSKYSNEAKILTFNRYGVISVQ
jgi:hypothetical protein